MVGLSAISTISVMADDPPADEVIVVTAKRIFESERDRCLEGRGHPLYCKSIAMDASSSYLVTALAMARIEREGLCDAAINAAVEAGADRDAFGAAIVAGGTAVAGGVCALAASPSTAGAIAAAAACGSAAAYALTQCVNE